VIKFIVCGCILAITFPAFAKEKKSENQEPIAWGLLSGNDGCVIFKEHRKVSGMFWSVAVTTKSMGALEVIETQNYKLEQTKWIETPENMDELQRLATKDKLKYVKIPTKYSDEQLEKARTMCRQPPS
jgi:hypothetical protein